MGVGLPWRFSLEGLTASASAPCGSETPAPGADEEAQGVSGPSGPGPAPTQGPEQSTVPEASTVGRGDAARGSRTPAASAEPSPMVVDEEAPSGDNLLSNFMPAPPMCAPPTCIVSKDVVDVGTFICAPLGPFGAIDYHGHPIKPDGVVGSGASVLLISLDMKHFVFGYTRRTRTSQGQYWTTFGGNRDKQDSGPVAVAMREFSEEHGREFPLWAHPCIGYVWSKHHVTFVVMCDPDYACWTFP